jgi:hypothetical protein
MTRRAWLPWLIVGYPLSGTAPGRGPLRSPGRGRAA